VSPLRRTLETAYYTFKDHPNFKQLQFIVHPQLREKITISGDVPLPNDRLLDELASTYRPMFEGRLNTVYLDEILARNMDEPWYF